MKLKYWVATHKEDRDCYSLIGKTEKAVEALVDEFGADLYEKPVCRCIEYTDAFDLLRQATGEGAGPSNLGHSMEK